MVRMDVVIREYRDEDRDEWMRVHAVILSISHAWNYSIQERPAYEGHPSTRLVALVDGKIVGLTDVHYDNTPGEVCFLKDSPGGYVLEFGRLPEYAGLNLGKQLMDATVEDAKAKGFHRLEYWSQDRNAQRFYRRLGMKEIGRHYRFRMRAPQVVLDGLSQDNLAVEYIYCACLPEEWPLVKQKYEIIEKHPLEPHLCVGFELRF
jgi:ribosomal protein S18 acetylase RimI-like enzyme